MKGAGGASLILVIIAVIVLFSSGVIKVHTPSFGGGGSGTAQSAGSHGSGTHGYHVKIPSGTCVQGAVCEPARQYAYNILASKGDASQFDCLINLWNGESGWDPWAVGPPTSNGDALGIPQALGHGHVFDLGDWRAQVDWGLHYIYDNVYGEGAHFHDPCSAWAFWQAQSPHWY